MNLNYSKSLGLIAVLYFTVGVNAQVTDSLKEKKIEEVVALVPDEWLEENVFGESAAGMRNIYASFLLTRIESSNIFVKEAQHARETFI